jgi:hypothetical protein
LSVNDVAHFNETVAVDEPSYVKAVIPSPSVKSGKSVVPTKLPVNEPVNEPDASVLVRVKLFIVVVVPPNVTVVSPIVVVGLVKLELGILSNEKSMVSEPGVPVMVIPETDEVLNVKVPEGSSANKLTPFTDAVAKAFVDVADVKYPESLFN